MTQYFLPVTSSKFFHVRLSGKFVVKLSLESPPHLTCVATLPCYLLVWENWQR